MPNIANVTSKVNAAPCRHAGGPPEHVVERVRALIAGIGQDERLLTASGLTPEEYRLALPAAIESLRGSTAASSSDRRTFLSGLLMSMVSKGLVAQVVGPRYGDDTVYRVSIHGYGDVAIIQKGCPDGAHSSTNWQTPGWAVETYLWWLCPLQSYEPGEHLVKGLQRVTRKLEAEEATRLEGVIFHDALCGSPQRPCPKALRSIVISNLKVPPPCVYLLPEKNRLGQRRLPESLRFPRLLLELFEIRNEPFISFVEWKRTSTRNRSLTVRGEFGSGRSTLFKE